MDKLSSQIFMLTIPVISSLFLFYGDGFLNFYIVEEGFNFWFSSVSIYVIYNSHMHDDIMICIIYIPCPWCLARAECMHASNIC